MRGLDRRTLLSVGGSAGLWVGLAPSIALGQTRPAGPPVARVEPVSETLHGQRIVDPYRWMENPRDPDWVPFMRGQADHARRVLDAIPGRQDMARRVAQLSGENAVVQSVQAAGPYLFTQVRPAGADSYRLLMRQGAGGDDRLLVDPNAGRTADTHRSLDWWQASPDGSKVVYGISPAGSENSILHVIETANGRVLPVRIDRTQYASPSWLPDGSGFFYNRLVEGAAAGSTDYYKNSVCWLHRVGTEPSADVRALSRAAHPDLEIQEIEFPAVIVQPGSRQAVAGLFGGVRPEVRLFTAPLDDVLAGRARWRKAVELADQVTGFTFRGDDLYLITYKEAPRYRILKTSLSEPNVARAREVAPAGRTVIQSLYAARDGVYVTQLDGGVGKLSRLDAQDRLRPVALPLEGSLFGGFANVQQDGFWMFVENFVTPDKLFRVAADGAVTDTRIVPVDDLDLTPFQQVRTMARSHDGAMVPVTLLHRADNPRNGTSPCLIEAYGSYGVTSDPSFRPRVIAFVEQGGVFAIAHVRGGGEYGREWHEAGRFATKPNTWRDAIAAAEHLIAERWTGAGKVALTGTSAGGIMAGRALTERPELWAAVISRVGVSNAMRSEFGQNGPPNVPEFGTVSDAAQFAALREMDALSHVADRTRYPAVMLTTGLTDPRVDPWQAGKMAARLQAATSSDAPVLLRVEYQAGHGLGSTRTQADQEWADIFAFVLWRAGHPRFSPRAG